MTSDALPLLILGLTVFLMLALLGRHSVVKRREEQELEPYRVRMVERMQRRQQDREEAKKTVRAQKDLKRQRDNATGIDQEEDTELMNRLRKVWHLSYRSCKGALANEPRECSSALLTRPSHKLLKSSDNDGMRGEGHF